MISNLNIHSAYFAQVNALVARRGSLKVISQAMWQTATDKISIERIDTKHMRQQMWDGIGIDCR